jgi:DNA ligase 1
MKDNKTFPELYSRDSKGNIVRWYIEVIYKYDDDDNTEEIGEISITHGRIDSISKSSNTRQITEGKNIGKANETTPFTQALKEAEAEWNKKRQEGYKSFVDLGLEGMTYSDTNDAIYDLEKYLPKYRTDPNDNLKPMKCQPFKPNKMTYPAYAQPKINGVRAVVRLEEETNGIFGTSEVVRIRSKEGHRYEVKHIELAFENIYAFGNACSNDIAFDGELYIPDVPVTSIGGASRNPNNPLHKDLIFVVFDLSIADVPQSDRLALIIKILHNVPTMGISNHLDRLKGITDVWANQKITSLVYKILNSDADAKYFKDSAINAGFEGIVIRDMKATYKFGSRPMTMLKYKNKEDAEFVILDIELSDKGKQPVFICRNDLNDNIFRVDGIKEYLDTKYYYDKDQYIGKLATVEFRERTVNGLPFHVNLIGIRDYE